MAETERPVRILHLDDDPIDAELVTLTLEMAKEHFSASVSFVQTEEQFVNALEKGEFDIILSDYRMPRFSGDEALKIAQEKCPSVPFIMVTGELGEERAIETLQRGATDYVLKDRMFRLIPAIRRALAEAENQRKRREAERERERLLEENQRRQGELWAIIQAMHDGVMVFDTEGRVVLVNQAEAEMLGYHHASELNQHLGYFVEHFELRYDDGTVVPVEDWPVSHVMRGESGVTRELKGRRKDTGKEWFFSFSGQPVWDETGRQILSVLVTRDVTMRRQDEGALRESEERYAVIFEKSPFATALTKMPERIIVGANEAFLTMFEYTREEVVGKTSVDLGISDPESQAQVVAELQARGFVRDLEAVRRTKSGVTRTLSLNLEWVTIAGTRFILTMIQDITERKRAEDNLRVLREELEERVRQRTAALERANQDLESFGYTVAHDLKAPLRAIDSFATLLGNSQAQGALSKKQQEYLSLIRSSTGLMRTLIESLLAFSRTARLVPQRVRVDMRALAEEVLRDERRNRSEAAKRVQVTLHELPPAPVGDPVLLRQVFANLINNAYKFTQKSENPKIEIGSSRRNGELVYYVRDNGVGFRKEEAEKLFQVFKRLHRKEEFEGTGVGLANVRKIIERHGGKAFAEGEEGKGATFYFSLPSPKE